jgi:hypothetical protein
LPENLKGKSFLPLPHLDCWYLVKGCLSWRPWCWLYLQPQSCRFKSWSWKHLVEAKVLYSSNFTAL